MDKNKELAKNTAIITVGKICTQFMSFFLMPLYTAVLSTEEYGIVDLVVTYTSLFLPVLLFQVDHALFRFLIDIRKDESSKKRVISTCMMFAIFQVIVSAVLFGIIQFFIAAEYKWYLFYNILASIFANMMLQSARGFGDNVTFAFGSFLSAASQIAGNLVFLLVFDMGIYGMLYATILSHVFTALFVFFKEKIYKYISVKNADKQTLKEILKYSVPLVPNALSWWVLNASDRTIVMVFIGTAANGLLSVGHKFSSVYITFYNIFNLSWSESASLHMNDPDRDEFFSGVISNMFKLFVCAGIGITACLPFLFPIMINEKFSEAYGVLPVFLLGSMLNIVVGLFSVIYVALKKTKEIAKTSIYAAVINIAVHLALVNFIGLYAAAVSTAVAFGLMALYRYFDLKKYIIIKFPKKWIFILAAVFGITCYFYYFGNPLTQFAALVMVAVVSIIANRQLIADGAKIVKNVIKKIVKKRES